MKLQTFYKPWQLINGWNCEITLKYSVINFTFTIGSVKCYPILRYWYFSKSIYVMLYFYFTIFIIDDLS